MGNGDYISKLVQGVRGEITRPETVKKEVIEHPEKIESVKVNSDFNELLENIRDFKVKGDDKRLIRIDYRNEDVLKHLRFLFDVNVTSFVNFLCWDFLRNNPELINEIQQSLKQLNR